MTDFNDLLIVDNDVVLDGINTPVFIHSRASIAQDILHMVQESGLLFELIAERSNDKKAVTLQQLILRVENDTRLIPGTVNIDEVANGQFYLTAQTDQYNNISVTL